MNSCCLTHLVESARRLRRVEDAMLWRRRMVFAAVGAMLLVTGCSPASDQQEADVERSEPSNDVVADTDGLIVIEDCPGTLADLDGVPCVGVVAGPSAAVVAGVDNAVRTAVADWTDDNDVVLTDLTVEGGGDAYLDNVDRLIAQGYEVIVILGQESDVVLPEAAETHSDVLFVGMDDLQVDPGELSNLVLVTHSDHEVGFLAGALAGLLTDTGDVAQVLGSSLVPPISDLRDGFVNGLAYTNSRADAAAFFHPGDPDVAFDDPRWGAATAGQAIEDGADVVFATGGDTGHGALVETAGRDGDALCIAVDFDKWDVVPEAQPCLVTSVEKLVGPAIDEILDAIAAGDPLQGEVQGPVGYSDFHDFADVIPSEVQQAADVVAEQVRTGEVSVTRSR